MKNMDNRKSNNTYIILAIALISMVPGVGGASDSNSTRYEKMNFGFNDCAVKWGELLEGVTEEDMVIRALAAQAKGFTFQPSLKYGQLMLGEYPYGCKSPSDQSWPLYLAISRYDKMSYGFNGCSVAWGELLKGVTKEDMIVRATASQANGFTFQASLKYGQLMMGNYPYDCKSPSDQSWPLYLGVQNYKKMSYGFNDCDVKWNNLLQDVTEEDMLVRGSAARSNGFTFQSSLEYGQLMSGEYPYGCKSPSDQSWPLYLAISSYKKMGYGFNGCDVEWGELLKGVTEEDMIVRATASQANGFTFQASLNYGKLMVGKYPYNCKSPRDQSWPLYLRTGAQAE